METLVSRRAVLGGAAAAVLGSGAALGSHGRRVLIATNEPWGTYHVKPLLAEAARRGWRLTQLVPDYSRTTPDDPVPVATPSDAPRADLLVVTGAGDWPADCVGRFRRLGWGLPTQPTGDALRKAILTLVGERGGGCATRRPSWPGPEGSGAVGGRRSRPGAFLVAGFRRREFRRAE